MLEEEIVGLDGDLTKNVEMPASLCEGIAG